MNFSRGQKTIFFIIICTAFLLRIWGINFGLPYCFHQDEPIVVNHALAYGSGDFNPHFFAIPPLTSYLLFFIYGVLFVSGKLLGSWATAEEFALQFFKDPAVFYLAGRFFIGVIPGTLCVILTRHLAGRFLSGRAALYAAAIMAVAFLNVINSHYIYTDMLLVACVILAYDSLLSVYRTRGAKHYCTAGIFMGLAMGVKYNGILLAVPYFLTHFTAARRDRALLRETVLSGKAWAGILSAAAAFLAANPFAVLDFRGFLRSVSHQSGAFWYTGWSHHILYSLSEGISVPLLTAGLAGLLLLLSKDRWGRIFVSFPLAFYLVLVFKSQPFSRYVLPLVPFLAIGASYLIFEFLYSRLIRAHLRRGLVVVSLVLLLPTLIKSVKGDTLFVSRDTRITAADWIKKNLPQGTKIACDSTTFRPALRQPYSQLMMKKEFLARQPGLGAVKSEKLKMQMKTLDKEREGYPLYFLSDEPESQGQFLDTVPALPYKVAALKKAGIEYVVINGQLTGEVKDRFLRWLESAAERVKDFSPYRDGTYRRSLDLTATTCIPVRSRELFLRRTTGPALRIYRIE